MTNLLKRLKKTKHLAKCIRWRDAYRCQAQGWNDTAISVFCHRLDCFVHLRPGTSDLIVLQKVVLKEEYEIPFSLEPRVIVDGGANIGLATLYFSRCYPAAKIYSIEPELSNYELLVKNVTGKINIKTYHAALWSRSARLCIQDTETEKWMFRIREGEAVDSVEALTMSDLISQVGGWDRYPEAGYRRGREGAVFWGVLRLAWKRRNNSYRVA